MKKILILLVTLCSFAAPVQAREYVLSILPRYYPEKLTEMMTPLAEYLSTQTGEKVRLELTKDFTDYENKVKSGAIDIGYQNPLIFSHVTVVHEAMAMAVDKEDGEKFRGIIISRPDSGIKKITDLSGKTVMIVSETSAGGYLSQNLSLIKAGIDRKAITFVTAAENRQENVIIPVSVGDVDAGFIRESALNIADKYIVPGSVAKVVETEWLPNWALSVKRDTPPAFRQKLLTALLALKEDNPVVKAIGINHFRQAADSDYAVMSSLAGH
jgi:phosphonate transport system substrate-binding protein